jgi:hypothetical protein
VFVLCFRCSVRLLPFFFLFLKLHARAHDACSLAESEEYFREYNASRLRESRAGCREREKKEKTQHGRICIEISTKITSKRRIGGAVREADCGTSA